MLLNVINPDQDLVFMLLYVGVTALLPMINKINKFLYIKKAGSIISLTPNS